MEVVKPGKNWSKVVTCTGRGNGGGGCCAKLRVFKEDLFTTSHQSYGDDMPDHYVTIECAQCGVKTDIGDVPEQVAPAVSKKRPTQSPTLVDHGDL